MKARERNLAGRFFLSPPHFEGEYEGEGRLFNARFARD